LTSATLSERESAGTGWGRAHRSAINKWYNQFDEEPTRLAYLATKYKARHKWNHKDVIRLAHVKPKNNPIGFHVASRNHWIISTIYRKF
jgi:60 kDa SS-A/Ro ribonucleoprotein